MKRIYINAKKIVSLFAIVASFYATNIHAQGSLTHILNEIETNNKTLKAARQSAHVQQIDAKTGIYPSDIDVNYEYLFGNKASNNQRESELTVSQSLDFPSTYFQKNKIANVKSEQANAQYRIVRQDVLLEAKLLCVELVYFNKLKEILTERMKNAEELNTSYQKRLKMGDANLLETNKIGLELLNTKTEFRLNEIEIVNRTQKLTELNGGDVIPFSDTTYTEQSLPLSLSELLQQSLDANPTLKSLEWEKEIASKSIGLAKGMSLPKINVGYKMSINNPERSHGFVAGLSIPLWENKNAVKRAKSQRILVDMEIDDNRLSQTNEVEQLYEKVIVLRKTNDEYKQLLSTQNSYQLLYKALSLGQISLLEYLTEINFLYQSQENYLQTEKEYYASMAQLLKFEQ